MLDVGFWILAKPLPGAGVSPPPRRDGSSGNRTVCAKPLWARCPSRTGSAGSLENCQLLPTIWSRGGRRRAGNIPASDPDSTPTVHGLASNAVTNDSAQTPPSAVARKSAPTPIQLSRARRGVWKAPAHAHGGVQNSPFVFLGESDYAGWLRRFLFSSFCCVQRWQCGREPPRV